MADFCASLWPEESTPENLINCGECGLNKHGSRMIWGEGNPQAPIMILLDNPGAREDRENKPFICGTRQTLQQAVHRVGLKPDDLYVTYVLKRRPTRSYDKDKTRQICMNHFNQQLKSKQPQFMVCLGNVAVQSFFQTQEAEVKSLRSKIHMVNGQQTAVSYHPLVVRRRPNLWPAFLEDWKLAADHYLNNFPINEVPISFKKTKTAAFQKKGSSCLITFILLYNLRKSSFNIFA